MSDLEKSILKEPQLKNPHDYYKLTEGVADLFTAGLLGTFAYLSVQLSYRCEIMGTIFRDLPVICKDLMAASTCFGMGSGALTCFGVKKGYDSVRKLTDFFTRK